MKSFQVVYVPFGVGTFHMESANKAFYESCCLLKHLEEKTIVPDGILMSPREVKEYLENTNPDLLVVQNVTFANAAYIAEVMHVFPQTPLLLWTLREPVIDGSKLRLNSLTGAYSAANTIRTFRKEPFAYIYGSCGEEKVVTKISEVIKAAKIRYGLKELRMSSIGHTPEGFGFGRALDQELLKTFGVHLESVEARELIERAKGYTDDEVEYYLTDAKRRTKGFGKIRKSNRYDFARLLKAYTNYVAENNIAALASRCWPDFFTEYGTPVCAVLGLLNEKGVSCACEADVYGALSMWMAKKATDSPAFFGDPVSLDESENTITFWHCGTAACSLAREDTGATVGIHCNRKIGPTMEFGCKPCERVTIFRVGRKPDGTFRFLLAEGKALDKPKQFLGTSVVVQPDANAGKLVYDTVKDGWEPHYAIAYGGCKEVLKELGNMLGIEIIEY